MEGGQYLFLVIELLILVATAVWALGKIRTDVNTAVARLDTRLGAIEENVKAVVHDADDIRDAVMSHAERIAKLEVRTEG